MISQILHTAHNGLKVLYTNSKILFVGILLFVFPVFFFWITQNFYTTAYSNINTTEKNQVSIIHDSITAVIESSDANESQLQNLLVKLHSELNNVSRMSILKEDPEGLLIIANINPKLLGTYEVDETPFKMLLGSATEAPEIHPLQDNAGNRVWQVFRKIDLNSNTYYIFSEHEFSVIDSLMSQRRQQSYFGLTAIFLFLIALAYWINKQTDWFNKYKKTKESLEERDLFTNMITHEFRTPLTAIKGYASFLEQSKSVKDEDARYAKNIRISTDRLVVLVNDFLEVSRIQSGKLAIEMSDVNLVTTIEKITHSLSPLAEKKGLGLSLIQPKQSITLHTDENRLIQILTNIVTNALKYTDSGSVTLSCEKDINEVTIKIMDTGKGISAKDQEKLFKPFVRVGKADNSTTIGSGLGMWITGQLVEILGGEIGVESIEGKGTHVVIKFPSK